MKSWKRKEKKRDLEDECTLQERIKDPKDLPEYKRRLRERRDRWKQRWHQPLKCCSWSPHQILQLQRGIRCQTHTLGNTRVRNWQYKLWLRLERGKRESNRYILRLGRDTCWRRSIQGHKRLQQTERNRTLEYSTMQISRVRGRQLVTYRASSRVCRQHCHREQHTSRSIQWRRLLPPNKYCRRYSHCHTSAGHNQMYTQFHQEQQDSIQWHQQPLPNRYCRRCSRCHKADARKSKQEKMRIHYSCTRVVKRKKPFTINIPEERNQWYKECLRGQ